MKDKTTVLNTTQVFLLIAGFVLCTFLLFLAAGQLFGGQVGSFGALERRVSAYIEHALACVLITSGAAAVIELIKERR